VAPLPTNARWGLRTVRGVDDKGMVVRVALREVLRFITDSAVHAVSRRAAQVAIVRQHRQAILNIS
jgi:hypothetical protein